jgi:hypothetical protein
LPTGTSLVSAFQPETDQVSEKREPQNTESAGGGNVEGKENFSIRNSLFDIRYSNWGN